MKKFNKILISVLVFYLSFFLILPLSLAQKEESSSFSSSSSEKYYLSLGADNELLMKVNVWGEVKTPGVLDVPDETDLISLLSFAGGPTDKAKLSKVKIIRNHSGKIIEVNIKRYVKNGDYKQIPVVKPGDTVVVPKNSFPGLGKFISFLYNVAVIASVVHVFTRD